MDVRLDGQGSGGLQLPSSSGGDLLAGSALPDSDGSSLGGVLKEGRHAWETRSAWPVLEVTSPAAAFLLPVQLLSPTSTLRAQLPYTH